MVTHGRLTYLLCCEDVAKYDVYLLRHILMHVAPAQQTLTRCHWRI